MSSSEKQPFKTVAPYGHWQSPISTDLLLQKATSLSEVLIPANCTSAADIAWIELRMSESGRSALMHSSTLSSDDATEVTVGKYNTRSGVHEYGGGSAASLADGSFIFTDYNPKSFNVLKAAEGGKGEPEVVTEENAAIRYADFGAHPTDSNLCLAIEEDHTEDTPSTVINSIVLFDLKSKPAKVHTLLKGRKAEENTEKGPQKRDFYTYARFSPNGKYVCWLTWNHPSMPWWDTQLWVAKFDNSNPDGPKLVGATQISLPTQESQQTVYQQPVWAIPSNSNKDSAKLFFSCDATGYLNLYSTIISSAGVQNAISISSPVAILPEKVDHDFTAPNWTLNNSDYIPLSPDLLIVTYFTGAKQNLGLINLRRPRLIPLHTPFVSMTQLRRLSSTSFALIAVRADEPSALLAINLSGLASNGYTLKESNVTVIKRSSTLVADSVIDKAYLSTANEIDFPTTLPSGERAVAHAIIFEPKNKDFVGPKGEAPPCVFNVHGGPSSSAGMGFNLQTQFWTSRGFMVCSVNYGGSTGYGREYLERLNKEWGVTDVLDCVAAAKFLGSKVSLNPVPFSKLSEKEQEKVWKELETEEDAVMEEEKVGNGGVKVTLKNTSDAWGWSDLLLAGVSIGAAVMGVSFVKEVMVNYSHCIPSLIRPGSALGREMVKVGVASLALVPYVSGKLGRVVSESVAVLPGMGVQLATTRALSLFGRKYMTRTNSRLIPEDRILDVYVGEGYRHFSIIDYLTLTTTTSNSKGANIERLFPNLLPHLPTCQRIYRILQSHLPTNSPLPHQASNKAQGSIANPNSMLISGGSAGGYTVLACLCFHPTIFSGGCSRYGVSSLQLLAEESHKFESQYPFQLIGGTPKSHPKLYHDRSPIYAASRIKAPVLLLQGNEDKVVPKSQADEFVKELKKGGGEEGRDWKYKVYEGEGHGFRKGENVKDSLEEELNWWTQHCLN